MSAVLHIQLLGRLRLRYGDDELMGIATPRLHALLAYLLLHREAAQPRQHIAYLFWPDSPESKSPGKPCGGAPTLLSSSTSPRSSMPYRKD